MLRIKETRRAFTLVELMMVITIIIVLVGLSTWGVFATVAAQQKRNTEATMGTVKKLLDARWNAVITDAKKETPSAEVILLAGGDTEMARARVIWVKVRLIEAFPMTYDEVNTALAVTTYIPLDRRKSHFKKYQAALKGKTGGGKGESAACLLLALTTLGSDSTPVEDQLANSIADTDGDGVKELVDGWREPFRFFRFATGDNVKQANPNASGGPFFDPVDGDGKLLTRGWYGNALRLTYETQFKHTISPDNGSSAFYVIPVIASAGKDRDWGVAPTDVNPTGPGAADNIFSFTLREN